MVVVVKPMELKLIEAKILILLSQLNNTKKNVQCLQGKLGVEYSYLCRKLRLMLEKGLLLRHQPDKQRKVFYDLKSKGRELLPKSKKILLAETSQRRL